MSKKAPSRLSGGTKPSKRRWEKLSVRFTTAEFCIRTVVALQHRPRTWQSEGCPANRHSKAHRNCRIKIFGRSSAWKHLQVVDTNLTIFPPSLMSICLISFEELGSALPFSDLIGLSLYAPPRFSAQGRRDPPG